MSQMQLSHGYISSGRVRTNGAAQFQLGLPRPSELPRVTLLVEARQTLPNLGSSRIHSPIYRPNKPYRG